MVFRKSRRKIELKEDVIIDNVKIDFVTQTKFLGVILDQHLKRGLYSCRRQLPTVLSLEQATTGVIASCRQNALKSSASINSRPTERQNDPSTEFKFKCEFKFEFKFLD